LLHSDAVVHGSPTVAPQALIKKTTGIARPIAFFNIFPLARTAKQRSLQPLRHATPFLSHLPG
jgi:hypothetical protein